MVDRGKLHSHDQGYGRKRWTKALCEGWWEGGGVAVTNKAHITITNLLDITEDSVLLGQQAPT